MTLQLNKWVIVSVGTCLASLCLGLTKNYANVKPPLRTTPAVNILIGQTGKHIYVTARNNTDQTIGLVQVAYEAGGVPQPLTETDRQVVKTDGTMVFKFRDVPAHGQKSIAAGYTKGDAETTPPQPRPTTVAQAAPSPGSVLP